MNVTSQIFTLSLSLTPIYIVLCMKIKKSLTWKHDLACYIKFSDLFVVNIAVNFFIYLFRAIDKALSKNQAAPKQGKEKLMILNFNDSLFVIVNGDFY